MAGPRTPKGRAKLCVDRLAEEYPGTTRDLCELDFTTPYQLLVATVLSAQTTDVRVNMVTPALFARYPLPADLAAADPAELEEMIRSTGFFRSKAKSLIALGEGIEERFGGEMPTAIEDLVTLAGVGRKTANVVRSVALGLPGFPVDTHVTRLTKLIGLTEATEPEKIEAAVGALVPKADWGPLSLRLILHGRRVCIARRPRCGDCVLGDFCPSFQAPVTAPAKKAVKAATAKKASATRPLSAP
jgi:endonuclease III